LKDLTNKSRDIALNGAEVVRWDPDIDSKSIDGLVQFS
jgi:hypothetical protein